MYKKAEALLDEYLCNINEHYRLARDSLDNWHLHRIHVEDANKWINMYLEAIEAFAYIGLIGDDEIYDRTTYIEDHFLERSFD